MVKLRPVHDREEVTRRAFFWNVAGSQTGSVPSDSTPESTKQVNIPTRSIILVRPKCVSLNDVDVDDDNLKVGEPLWVDQVLVLMVIIGTEKTISGDQFFADLGTLPHMALPSYWRHNIRSKIGKH